MRVDVRDEASSTAKEVSKLTATSAFLLNVEANRTIDLPDGDSSPVVWPQFCLVRSEMRSPVLLLMAWSSASVRPVDVMLHWSRG